MESKGMRSMTLGISLAAGAAGPVYARHRSVFGAPLLIWKVYSLTRGRWVSC